MCIPPEPPPQNLAWKSELGQQPGEMDMYPHVLGCGSPTWSSVKPLVASCLDPYFHEKKLMVIELQSARAAPVPRRGQAGLLVPWERAGPRLAGPWWSLRKEASQAPAEASPLPFLLTPSHSPLKLTFVPPASGGRARDLGLPVSLCNCVFFPQIVAGRDSRILPQRQGCAGWL